MVKVQYLDQLSKFRSRFRRQRLFNALFFLFLLGQLPLSLFMLSDDYIRPLGYLNIFVTISVVAFLVYGALKKSRLESSILSLPELPAGHPPASDIKNQIELAAGIFDFPAPPVSVRLSLGNGVCPSMLQYDEVFIIVVPPKFVHLLFTSRAEALAMISHEIGHYFQDDARIWLYHEGYARVLQVYVVLSASLYLLFAALMYFNTGELREVTLSAVVSLYGFFQINRYDRLRKESEILADSFAALVSGKNAIVSAIENWVQETSPLSELPFPVEEDHVALAWGPHPPKFFRLAHLHEQVQRA